MMRRLSHRTAGWLFPTLTFSSSTARMESYPRSRVESISACTNQPSRGKGTQRVNFLRWAYKDGEKTAATLDYAPLPASMVAQLQNRLKAIRSAGTQVGDAR